MRLAALHPPVDDTPIERAQVPEHYRLARQFPEHHWDEIVVGKATAVAQARAVALAGYDVVVNLCDGGWDEPFAGVEVAQTLERFGAAYTGASPAFFDVPRPVAKLAAQASGVAVPAHAVVRSPDDPALRDLRFPLLVKPTQGCGSIWLERDARVADAEALRDRVRRLCDALGDALVEEFVEGREVTVLVALGADGPVVFPPIEYLFPPGETFKHRALKWDDFDRLRTGPVADAALRAEVERSTRDVFCALHGDGYARVDLRVDRDGRPWFLEINANCGVFFPQSEYGSADLVLAGSTGHAAFLELLLAAARRRRDHTRPAWSLVHRDGRFAMAAARDLPAGFVVDGAITRAAVGLDPSLSPDGWRPLPHCSAPNVALRGERLTTLRDVVAGEVFALPR